MTKFVHHFQCAVLWAATAYAAATGDERVPWLLLSSCIMQVGAIILIVATGRKEPTQ